MRLFYVYILKCSDDSFYTGETDNLDRRFNEHQQGIHSTSYTYSRRPVELVFYTEFPTLSQALLFEKQVKGWSRKKKEALISKNWENLKLFAECNNSTHSKNHIK
ncbi:MAG: GIY-YIG nuclease family protein [Bacteroidales bacterium]|nr:GIY-YIG nuclease family protein [Bacteroidales bacterium]